MERLVKQVSSVPQEALEDLLYVMMSNVEDALRTAGAKPGKDYTYRDLLVAATPFALFMFSREGSPVTFAFEKVGH